MSGRKNESKFQIDASTKKSSHFLILVFRMLKQMDCEDASSLK